MARKRIAFQMMSPSHSEVGEKRRRTDDDESSSEESTSDSTWSPSSESDESEPLTPVARVHTRSQRLEFPPVVAGNANESMDKADEQVDAESDFSSTTESLEDEEEEEELMSEEEDEEEDTEDDSYSDDDSFVTSEEEEDEGNDEDALNPSAAIPETTFAEETIAIHTIPEETTEKA